MIFIVLLVLISTGASGMETADMQAMNDCFYTILCDARKPMEFRRIVRKAPNELIQLGTQWLWEFSKLKFVETPEFWNSLPDHKCNLSKETKEEFFNELVQLIGEYWMKACAEAESENCIKMTKVEHEFNTVIAEYTAKGVCTKGQELVENGFKDSKSSVKEIKNKSPAVKMFR